MHASLITLDQPMRNLPTLRATTKSPSRILAIKLEALTPARKSWAAISESFLRFSPRVWFRVLTPPALSESPSVAFASSAWIFIDIASTSHLFLGEEELVRTTAGLAKDLGFGVKLAVSDTPAGAQAFATSHPGKIIPSGEEREWLKRLSLPHLLHLEGVKAWTQPSKIESIITFFLMLGFKTADELGRFTVNSFQERWGDLGTLFWKRVNALDHQVISPMLATEPLQDYVHLDFPISLVSLLLHQTEKSLDYLFGRLQGRNLFARKLVLVLHCEYSKAQHKIEIEPNTPNRNRELFATLLEKRLDDLDLLNPIRDLEMSIVPCPEKEGQLDFFEPRVSDGDKLQTLFSLLLQSGVKPGLYEIEPSILPERGWQLVSDLERAKVSKKDSDAIASKAKGYGLDDVDVISVASAPEYGINIAKAPRPARILRSPIPLTIEEMQGLKVLSQNPIERLEDAWWEEARAPNEPGLKRDYYFAVSMEGQCLWIFQDLNSDEYFVHGYFD